MRALLPDAVAVVEDLTGARHSQPLLPQEAAALGAVARKRRLEFTAGRNCARAALSRIGVAPVPVLSGEERDPQWPAGGVGGITHAEGDCAAAVPHPRGGVALGNCAEA